MSSRLSKISITALAACLSGTVVYALSDYWSLPRFISEAANTNPSTQVDQKENKPANDNNKKPAVRSEQLKLLKTGDFFDVLVIGGGATGVGCALDAVTRGLKTALVEANDFASGTSSKSTKLIHGGMRYLHRAISKFDKVQYSMVKEALQERGLLMQNAPHLAKPLPIMIPIYSWWKVPYYWIGVKCYDFLAGKQNLKNSYYISKKTALELFPLLKSDGLCGALVYYDGQHDDARMCLSIALTAANKGAAICNYVEVVKLLKRKDCEGKSIICGARVRDHFSRKEFDIKAKCVINSTGPFTDSIRKMDDPTVCNICAPSSGVHIILPGCFCPDSMGLLDPATSDGRVIFFLPWQGYAMAGTTDLPCEITSSPQPTEEEIDFILDEIRNYFPADVQVKRSSVLSAWSGIRPLVSDPNEPNTSALARSHIIHISPSQLITIAGGKWTTYRAMAEHTIDAAIKACNLQPKCPDSQTKRLKLNGAEDWSPSLYVHLMQRFGLDCDVSKHLVHTYGSQAVDVAKLAAPTQKDWPAAGQKMHPDFPYIDAQIRYAVQNEFACTLVDMIARRFRLAFLNVAATEIVLPHVANIMAEELNWTDAEKQAQLELALDFLDTEMNSKVRPETQLNFNVQLSKDELQIFVNIFHLVDREGKGQVSVENIQGTFQIENNFEASIQEIRESLAAINTSPHSLIDLNTYLKMIEAIKTNNIKQFTRMSKLAQDLEAKRLENFRNLKKTIVIERACGGP